MVPKLLAASIVFLAVPPPASAAALAGPPPVVIAADVGIGGARPPVGVYDLSPAIEGQQPAASVWLRPGGLLRAIDGTGDRRLDNEIPGFELDGVLAVIPEPRVWALLLAGYALIGFGLRRGRDRARRVTG
jgi:hypothetical protein